jgi:selenocysteine-specific elongation factor
VHIVGTAGHVDHGKSSLVTALTGTNPDRWIEEQLRGMTLDLGFAHLVLDGGLEAGIVDVPGHERFLHNMLAGAAGMDVLLLVVDVHEGVMPQTVEHLEILKYLNVRRTIVALTKADLVSQEEFDAAREEIVARLRGTIAQDAPVVGVSSTTGAGIDELRERIEQTLRELPARDASAPVYLPVDRVFALPGLGTIVTGTLMQGSIATGDELSLEPSGKRVRVRSAHVFGKARERVTAGSRVALNVPGVDRHEIERGEAVVNREFSARTTLAVRFTPLPLALPLLRRRTQVHAYIGSAEILATLVFEQAPTEASEVNAELQLRVPAVAFPGVRFVVRRPSPKTLLGGGYVEGVHASAPAQERTPNEEAVLGVLAQRGLEAVETRDVALAANVREEAALQALESLEAAGDAIRVARPAGFVYGAAAGALLRCVLDRLEEVHRSEPWALGTTSIALAQHCRVPEPLLVRILASYADAGKLANRGGYYATLEFSPELTQEQLAFFDGIVPISPGEPFAPAAYDEAAQIVRKAQVRGAAKAFDTLLARGAFVKVGDFLYRGSQITAIRSRVDTFLRERERMTAAEFRDLLGTTRKFAVPLLEWLDARGVTLRSGDYRTLRKRST